MLKNPENRNYLSLLVIILLVMSYAGISSRDIYTRGEGREALVAQSMLNSGNWILPEAYNNAVPSKPPFLHWIVSGFSVLNGNVSELTARLPSVIFYFFCTLFFYFFLYKRSKGGAAIISCLILTTSVEWYRAGITCRVDMVFSSMFFLGLLSLFVWQEKGLRGVPFLSILLLGCAVLCKGPVAIVLPALIFTVYLYYKKTSLYQITKSIIIVFVPAAIIAFSWYLAAYLQSGQPFLDKIYYENAARFLGSMEDEPHKHGILYLISTIPLGFMPWTLLIIPFFVFTIWQNRKNILIDAKSDFLIFSIIAVCSVILFFSIPSSKRSVYLLPAYPFMSFIISSWLNQHILKYERVFSKTSFFIVSLAALLFLFLLILFVFNDFNYPLNNEKFEFYHLFFKFVADNNYILTVVLLLAVVLFGFYLLRCTKIPLIKIAAFFALIIFTLQYVFIGPYSDFLSPRKFAQQLNAANPDNKKYFSYLNEFYALSFYSNRKFFSLNETVLPQEGVIVIFRENLQKLSNLYNKQFKPEIESSNYVEKPLNRLIAVKIDKHT